MPLAAPTFWNVTMGKPRISGQPNIAIAPATAVGGDISFVVSTAANVVTAGAFLAAAQEIARHMQSSGLLK